LGSMCSNYHPPDGSGRQGLPLVSLEKKDLEGEAGRGKLANTCDAGNTFPMPRRFTRTGGGVSGKRLSDPVPFDDQRPLCDLCDFFVPQQQLLRNFFDPVRFCARGRFFGPARFCAPARFFGPPSFFSLGYGNYKKIAFGRIPSACPHDRPSRKKSRDSPLIAPLMRHFSVGLRWDDHCFTGSSALETARLSM